MATVAGARVLHDLRTRLRRAEPTADIAKRRAQLALFVLILLLAAVLGTGVYASYVLYHSADDRYIGVVLPLQTATRDLVQHMVDEETGVRGYIITNKRYSLSPYSAGRDGVRRDLTTITSLTRNRPELATRLRLLRSEIHALHGFYDREITLVADGQLGDGLEGQHLARRAVLDATVLFNHFRATSTQLQGDIEAFSQETRDQQRRTYRQALGTLGIAGVAALGIAITLLFNVPERLRLLYAAEQEARERAEQGANSARALAHVSDAVLLIDSRGTVLSWNAAAERMFGRNVAETIGRRAQEVVPAYAQLVEGDRNGDAFVPVTVAGDELWLAPSRSDFEGGTVLTIRDATAGYALERTRADFVTTASHELRTPLTAVYGGVRTLLERGDSLDEAQRLRLLRVIEQESGHLAEIVDQLLVTAQLDRGSLRVGSEPCDIRALCERVLDAASARNADATLVLEAGADVGTIMCDESLLRQVLVNLVENGLKYSPGPGRITITITPARDDVRVEVTDEGLGIPPSEQDRIFDKFYRLDAEMTRGVGGSGLGLYISREIVTQMNGTLSVRSVPGEGSTFTVTLPRR
jgi:two-component system, OmpR family, phosphate regulon sensor histidine kinase PhoR